MTCSTISSQLVPENLRFLVDGWLTEVLIAPISHSPAAVDAGVRNFGISHYWKRHSPQLRWFKNFHHKEVEQNVVEASAVEDSDGTLLGDPADGPPGDGSDTGGDVLMQDIDLWPSQGSDVDGEHESDEEAEAQFISLFRPNQREALAGTRNVHWLSSSPLSSPPMSEEEEAEAQTIQHPSLIVKLKLNDHSLKSSADTFEVRSPSGSLLSSPPESEEEEGEKTTIQRPSRIVTPDLLGREKFLDEIMGEIMDERWPLTSPLSSPPKSEKEEGETENNQRSSLIITPEPRRHSMEPLAEILGVRWPSNSLLISLSKDAEYESLCSDATIACMANLLDRSRQTREGSRIYRESSPEESPSKRRRMK